jgi:hypothetical protein
MSSENIRVKAMKPSIAYDGELVSLIMLLVKPHTASLLDQGICSSILALRRSMWFGGALFTCRNSPLQLNSSRSRARSLRRDPDVTRMKKIAETKDQLLSLSKRRLKNSDRMSVAPTRMEVEVGMPTVEGRLYQ